MVKEGYKVPYCFSICDKCNTVWPWLYVYCGKYSCQNPKLRYEGDIPDIRHMAAELDPVSRERLKYG